MFATTFFSIAAFLVASVFAAPSTSVPPFQLTDISIKKVLGGNVTLQYTVYDPEPLTKATQTCTYSWTTGSKGFPTGAYEPCNGSPFAWIMESFTSIESFVLSIEHSYKDPAIGNPPYDYVTNFGKATINTSAAMTCTKLANGNENCVQKKGTIIKAPIYATDAKRR